MTFVTVLTNFFLASNIFPLYLKTIPRYERESAISNSAPFSLAI